MDAEIAAHIIISDLAISLMSPTFTNQQEFVVVVDCTSPPPPHFTFLSKILDGFVRGYPDRLNSIHIAPAGTIIGTVVSHFIPKFPGQLASKIVMHNSMDEASTVLKDILVGGEADVPTFLGGVCDHDAYYPDEGFGVGVDLDDLNQGPLMFDIEGMINRQTIKLTSFMSSMVEEGKRIGRDSTEEETIDGDAE